MLLWPPLALPELHLYPATHTAFRQSQVPLGAAAAAAAQPPGSPAARAMATLPGFASAGLHAAVGVDLEPGDCVYIPPYWGHGVYSVEPSVSLASFSNSWEQARWATILYLPSISHIPLLYLTSISPLSPTRMYLPSISPLCSGALGPLGMDRRAARPLRARAVRPRARRRAGAARFPSRHGSRARRRPSRLHLTGGVSSEASSKQCAAHPAW